MGRRSRPRTSTSSSASASLSRRSRRARRAACRCCSWSIHACRRTSIASRFHIPSSSSPLAEPRGDARRERARIVPRHGEDRALRRDRRSPARRSRAGTRPAGVPCDGGNPVPDFVRADAALHRRPGGELREKNMAHSASPSERQAHYAVPAPMPWPIMGASALFLMALGAVFVFNGRAGGWVSIAAGAALLIYMMVRWFGDVISESEAGKYGHWEDLSFRWGMSFFIFSEVMFFAAFFGTLYWLRQMSVPELGNLEHQALVWPGFTGHWPSAGPGFAEEFSAMGAWGLPAVNTLLLLTSGVTVTFAHLALIRNDRSKLILWLGATILLGVAFLACQATEYA